MNTSHRLIITDNEVMARQIAEAFGEVKMQKALPLYQTETTSVLWTGGEMIELTLKDTFQCDGFGLSKDADTIVRSYYDAIPRRVRNIITTIDQFRISYLENAETFADEIIFMCQPTDEGERIIQALKLFFGFKVPTRTIICEWFTPTIIKNAVENGIHHTSKLIEFFSDEAMRRIFGSDMARLEPLKVDTEEISFMAFDLFDGIKRLDFMKARTDKFQNRAYDLGVLDINTLYAEMSVRYDMTMWSLWDSLVYLYGRGLISNPMTYLPEEPNNTIVYGQGSPEYNKAVRFKDGTLLHLGIVPTVNRDDSLIGLEYDHKNHPDAFMPRTSAIYSFIVDFADCNKEHERYDYLDGSNEGGVPVTEIETFLVNGNPDFYTKSVKDCFGTLMWELECAELITIDKGLVKITELGYALSEDGELILSD